MWWSGLLAAETFTHLLRTLTGLPVQAGTTMVPLWVSWVVCPVTGIASLWLYGRRAGLIAVRPATLERP